MDRPPEDRRPNEADGPPGETPSEPAPGPLAAPPTRELGAVLLVALLVLFAAGIGLALGARSRATPTPGPRGGSVVALPSASPLDPAVAEARAFAQPLVGGCATDRSVWLFADGGAVVRFDGRRWSIPDPTLRSMLAAACRPGSALAVGRLGNLLTIDEDRGQLRLDRVGVAVGDELSSVVIVPDGAVAVGDAGTVLLQSPLEWEAIGVGISEDLRGVAVTGRTIWVVGAAGASYRLEAGRWVAVETGTAVTLRAVAMPAPDVAVAAGDGGTLLRLAGGSWTRLESGTEAALRGAAAVGTATWIVGDRGTVLEVIGERVRRVDLGTACTLRAVFAQDAQIWIVGSDGVRGAAWRISPSGTTTWGSC